jgi:hypothetical protein
MFVLLRKANGQYSTRMTKTYDGPRYHWLGEQVHDLTIEPQAAICCDQVSETLNSYPQIKNQSEA